MLLPAFTGLGEAILETPRTGEDVTVVVSLGPVWASDWLLAIVQPLLVMTVPLASGLFTLTTSCTDPEAPAPTAPMFQVTTPPDGAPPAVADTNAVFAGTGSLITTPVAFAVPVFWYERV